MYFKSMDTVRFIEHINSDIDEHTFISFPITNYNNKKLLFTDENLYFKKISLCFLLPFSIIADLILLVPRKIINYISKKI